MEVEIDKSIPCRPSFENFPLDFMTADQRRHGGIVAHFLIAFYMFGAVTLVCDKYFVPSLKRITIRFKVRSDVAGATFMAAGGSAAELFICIVGVFVAKNDIGPGTVVGSAAFNVLFVVGLCGLFAGSVVRLSRWPLLRDSFCYVLSIGALVAIIFDGKVYWYEALLLVFMYVFYIVIMYHNQALEEFFFKKLTKITEKTSQTSNDIEKNEEDDEKTTLLSKEKEGEKLRQEEKRLLITESQIQVQINQNDESPFSLPEGTFQRSLWLMELPVLCLMYLTIPDCSKDRWKKWYFVTFIGSLIWIGLLTYILVWVVSIIGFTLGISDVIMGLTFLAAGGSVSDGISSLIVARQGDGNMAVANVFGSNLFDILLSLGLPWLFKTSLIDYGGHVNVEDGHVSYTLLCLLAGVILAMLSIMLNKWRLSKFLGLIFLIFFTAFLTVAVLCEFYLR